MSVARTIRTGLNTAKMGEFVFNLIFGLGELLIAVVWDFFIPVVCYFTAVLLVPAATFGKVTVRYPKISGKMGWGLQHAIDRSAEGKIILSPALGAIIGLALWSLAVAVLLQYFSLTSPDIRAIQASNQS